MKQRYIISVNEIHSATYAVEANSEEETKQLFQNWSNSYPKSEPEFIDSQYSHIDFDTLVIEDITESE